MASSAFSQSFVRRDTSNIIGRMVWDPVRESLVSVAVDFDAEALRVFEWSAAGWELQPDFGSAPGHLGDFGLAWDGINERVLLFGGSATISQTTGPRDETWTWDGRRWEQLHPASKPSARAGHSMAWDSVRQRVVLFGGRLTGSDTWEWDGITWAQRHPATVPATTDSYAMAFDAARGVVVMQGGRAGSRITDETWLWDGNDWALAQPTNSPGFQVQHGMTYDPVRQRVLLRTSLSSGMTWSWNGQDWSQEPNLGSPRPSSRVSMAWHPPSNGVLAQLAGGNGGFGVPGTAFTSYMPTWAWDGSQWSLVDDHGPGGLDRVLVYDAVRGESVTWNEVTWAFDGRGWSAVSPRIDPGVSGPTSRDCAGAFHHGTAEIVAFGGLVQGVASDQTWLWNGSTWRLATPAVSPPPRGRCSMVSDPARDRVVMFGGTARSAFGNLDLDDTWEWDGSTWTQIMTTQQPSPRRIASMIYDPSRGAVLLYGGNDQGPVAPSDTWSFDGSNWFDLGIPRSSAALSFFQLAWDPVGRRALLLDNRSGGSRELTAQGWVNASIRDVPESIALATDTSRNVIVSFDGDDTWLMGSPTKAQVNELGAPCSDAHLTAFGFPWLGHAEFAVRIERAQPGTAVAIMMSASSATVPLPGGCTLRVDPATILASVGGVASSAGNWHVALGIGTDPALVGLQLVFQGVATDAAAPVGVTLTQGLELVVGD